MDKYCFVGWGEFLTADWMQVWGGILAAFLGAAAAVAGAVWFEGRKARLDRKNYAAMLSAVVQRILIKSHTLIDSLERDPPGDFEENVRALKAQSNLLYAFSPFVGLGSYELVADVISVVDGLAAVTSFIDEVDLRRSRPIPEGASHYIRMLHAMGVQDRASLIVAANDLHEACRTALHSLTRK